MTIRKNGFSPKDRLPFLRLIALTLCAAMLLPLLGCAKENAPVETTENTVSTVSTEHTEVTEPSETEIIASVSDAFSDVLVDGESLYCYHIPQVQLTGDLGSALNKAMYDELYGILTEEAYAPYQELHYPYLSEMVYTWGQKENLVSIVVQTDSAIASNPNFYVYTISAETGEEAASDALYAAYGLDENGFFELVKQTMQRYWDEQRSDLESHFGEDFFQSLVDQTLADDNVKAAIPYINAKGELCAVARIFSPAGAESNLHLLNLSQKADEGWIACTVDHYADSPSLP